ncbi:hypothetical protein ACSBR2_025335 [Camellia fascicularis]
MDKIVISLGVHKKLKKHSKKKGLLKKLIHYLKSDTYMFAPLVSPQPSDFLPTNTLPTGVEIMKSSKEKDQKLLKKVGEYLKSDCYMYAPLICRQPSHDFDANIVTPPSGPVWHLKRVTTAASTRKITQPSDNSHLKSSTVLRQTHRETVKHIAHQNCRSSSVPGKGLLETERRKLVVE